MKKNLVVLPGSFLDRTATRAFVNGLELPLMASIQVSQDNIDECPSVEMHLIVDSVSYASAPPTLPLRIEKFTADTRRKDKYYFRFVAEGNNEIIGVSEGYRSTSARNATIKLHQQCGFQGRVVSVR